MSTIMQARGLSRTYSGSSQEVLALRNLDLDVAQGEFLCIMGSSGSGKSTLLNVLSGLDRASAGTVEFQGKAIQDLDEAALALLRRRGFGFVFQNINLVPSLSLKENILIAGFLQDGPRRRVREAVALRSADLLKALAIEDLADRLPSETSGGQQQRAAIARALINQPAILFADEPTGALNYTTGQDLLDFFNTLNQSGQTIVMVSHDLKAASRARRVIFMRDGSMVGELALGAMDGAGLLQEREQRLFAWLAERGW